MDALGHRLLFLLLVNHCSQFKCYPCQQPHLHTNADVVGIGIGSGIGTLLRYVVSIIISAANIVGHCCGLCGCQFGWSSRGLRGLWRLWWPPWWLWWWIWGLWWIWRWLRRLRRLWWLPWWLSWLRDIQICFSQLILFDSPDFALLGVLLQKTTNTWNCPHSGQLGMLSLNKEGMVTLSN